MKILKYFYENTEIFLWYSDRLVKLVVFAEKILIMSLKNFYTRIKLIKPCEVRVERLPVLRRSTRQPKSMKEERKLETIYSCLAVNDDSKHGLEIAPIENKGRGIKVG